MTERLKQAGFSTTDSSALGDLSGAAISAYQSSDDAMFRDLLSRQGIEAHGVPDRSSDDWKVETSALRNATLAAKQLDVQSWTKHGGRWTPLHGQAAEPGQMGIDLFLKESRGAGDLEDAFSTAKSVVEITIPGAFSNFRGVPKSGTLSLVFAQRPDNSKWVLVGTRLRDLYMQAVDNVYITPPLK